MDRIIGWLPHSVMCLFLLGLKSSIVVSKQVTSVPNMLGTIQKTKKMFTSSLRQALCTAVLHTTVPAHSYGAMG
jgi:hypothetical protein